MPTIHVPGDAATIAAATALAAPGDTIQLDPGYKNETPTVTVDNLIFAGDASNTGVTLTFGPGVGTIHLTGFAPWRVIDNAGDNVVTGNGILAGPDGVTTVTVSAGHDNVDGGVNVGGLDTLIVNYGASTKNILTVLDPSDPNGTTGRYTDNVANSVDYRGFENFRVTTGSGNDSIVTPNGNAAGQIDIVSTGAGDDSIDTKGGPAIVDGGSGTDFWTAQNLGPITLDLNLAATQSIGGGSQATSIERVSLNLGGTSTIVTRVGNPNDGLNDTIIDPTGGNDTVTVGGGDDVANLGLGFDTLIINYAAETRAITTAGDPSGAGLATYSDGLNTSVTFGGVDAFRITLGSGADLIQAGHGDDYIRGNGGADILDGAGGVDVADYSDKSAAVAVKLSGAVDAQVTVGGVAEDKLKNIENLIGGSGADSFTGDDGVNVLDGRAGDDLFVNSGSFDTLIGGAGSDTANFSAIDRPVAVFLNGASYAQVTVNGAQDDVIKEIENFIGGSVQDSLVGDGAANFLQGRDGPDSLFGNGFNADGSLKSGAGNDRLDGGAGDDGLFAGDGADTLTGGDGGDGMVGGAGNDALNGGPGDDFLFGGAFSASDGSRLANSGADTLNGGDGRDGLYGFDGDDTINGDAGDDYIEGGDGADAINGGGGSDYVLGQNGADSVTGGAGFDYLYGGTGGDAFIFRRSDSADWILDFSVTEGDRLRFLDFGFANFAAIPLVDLSTPGHPAVQMTITIAGATDQLTIFGATLAQLNATNVLVA